MNRKFIAALCLFFIYGIIMGQQWYSFPVASFADVNAVVIQKPGVINLGGGHENSPDAQAMYSTTDYGYTWIPNYATDGLGPWNKSIAFLDSLVGYGVGDKGRILKTTNAGLDFYIDATPVNRTLNKIVRIQNTSVFYVVGGFRDSLCTVLKSSDGGQNWQVNYDQPGQWLTAVYFIDTLKGFAVGDSGTILSTINGGAAWTPVSASLIRDFTGITFTNASTGFITGGIHDSLRTILTTVNGGAAWTVLKDETGGMLNDVWFIDSNTGYATGDSGTLLKTTNGGQNWAAQTITGATGNESFRAVRFYTDSFGVVAGTAGTVYIYASLQTPEVKQVQALHNDSVSRFFQALVNTHGVPSHLYFVYATDTGFTQNVNYSYQVNMTSDSFITYGAYMAGIHPNTLYYYKAVLASAAGVISSPVQTLYNGVSPYLFKATTATNVTGTSAQLNAVLNKMPVALQLNFKYGPTHALGNQVAAIPNSVNDSLLHTLTATLTGLQPNTTYYYVLEGTGFTNFISDTIGFYTGTNHPVVTTFPGVNYDDTSVIFKGTVQNFLFPATVTFLYGTTPALGSEVVGNPYYIYDSALYADVQMIHGLQPQTVYYYCIKAVSAADTLYGDTVMVFSGHLFDLYNALAATNITNSSAQLNAEVDGLTLSTTLNFEYGPTASFGNEVSATPALVNDGLHHYLTAQLSGLNTGTFYYYRLKGLTPSGFQYYSDTRQVFVGENEIPNWDFEYWQNRIALVPRNWIILGKTAEQVPGQTGYGLKLNARDVAINSMFSNSNDSGAPPIFIDGEPFHARPDSVWLYIKANEAPGDTPVMLVQLYSGPTMMAFNRFTLPANTGGAFQRVAFPISYSSPATPDSIVIGLGPCLAIGDKPCNLGSNITVDDIGFSPVSPPLPNTDFEDWVSYSYTELEGWFTSNIASTNLNLGDVPCVTETYSSPPNDHAAKIQNYVWNGNLLGAEINQRKDYLGGGPSFPVYGRHQTFNGYFEWFPVNGDSAIIAAMMYKHGQYIGGAQLWAVDSVTSFTQFNLPIIYFDSIAIPDSAAIQISAFTRHVSGTSTLMIDKLRFDNQVVLSTNQASPVEAENIKVYPNPGQNRLVIEPTLPFSESDRIQLIDLNGNVAMDVKALPGYKTVLDITTISNGFYMLRVRNNQITFNKKVVVIK